MYISKNWLQDYVFLPDSFDSKEFASDLTLHTVEVDGVEDLQKELSGVVVGKILDIKKHPESDKLSIAQVDVGEDKPRQILFGKLAKMEVGLKTAIALAPTILHGKEINKIKIAGEASEGMLCLLQELGLKGEDEELEAPYFGDEIKVGTPIVEALEIMDVILDIDNKSMTHRPDLWGHYGMAREIAAIYRKKLQDVNVPKIQEGNDMEVLIHVEDTELCPRYMGVALSGITVAQSPDWLQRRLRSVGLRPINNIVDVTNYIMFDLGQPMHAFDLSKISTENNTLNLHIRMAKEGEKLEVLDGKEYELFQTALLIADKKNPLAVGGVIGGMQSSVQNETTSIFLESANFQAVNVRRTSTKLGIRTDASSRFEKSLDPQNCAVALQKAVQIILQICPNAKVVSNVADARNFSSTQKSIEVPLEFLWKKIGQEIPEKEVISILERLGFSVKEKKGVLLIDIPSWRATKDISIPEDIVEEVARMFGYGNITPHLPNFSIIPPHRDPLQEVMKKVRSSLALSETYTEVFNYSFESKDWLKKIGEDISLYLELDNPVAKDRPLIRRHLYPSLLENVANNLHRFDEVKIFEIGKVYHQEENGERTKPSSSDLLPRQDEFLGFAYAKKGDETPFFEVSGAIVEVLETLGIYNIQFEKFQTPPNLAHSSRTAQIVLEGNVVGMIIELQPRAAKNIGIDERVVVAELVLNRLLEHVSDPVKYKPIPEFPSVERDFAFLVDVHVEHAEIQKAIEGVSDLIVGVYLFDVYTGKHVEAGKKSMAYRIEYRSPKKTLVGGEVEKIHMDVLNKLNKKFGAEIRK